jgi:hypothetical protein
VFTDGRQQRQPNHNTTKYYVNRRKTTTTIICGRIMIGLSLLSSVNKHTMWSYYDWVYCCCRPSVNIICGHIMIGLSLLSKYYVNRRKTTTTTQSKHDHILCSLTDDNDNPIITRPPIVFTDGTQRQPIITRPHIVFTSLSYVSKRNMWSYYDWVVVVVVPQ